MIQLRQEQEILLTGKNMMKSGSVADHHSLWLPLAPGLYQSRVIAMGVTGIYIKTNLQRWPHLLYHNG
jgi:hypothetical protein